MISKNSRYNRCETYVALDVNGRSTRVTAPREPRQVEARFQHIITGTDRLDSLAQKYYRRPKKWWQICDANPEFMFPGDLLSDAAVKTVCFPVERMCFGKDESIAALLSELRGMQGVEEADAVYDERFSAEEDDNGNAAMLPFNCIQIRYNHSLIDLEVLVGRLRRNIVDMKEPLSIGRTGKKIAIPPDRVMG